MHCAEFENQLSDYVEGLLDPETHRLLAAHALRCPVCHETLTEVRYTMQACRLASVPAPPRDLEARILNSTAPQSTMSCDDFEEFLTDYLDGFLPASLYHRWERHAASCERCTELPGEVVRTIGACYSYISEEQPVPLGLNERILHATLGTLTPQEIRAPWTSRLASRLRMWLDPIVSPQLATVATMLLVAVLVLTNTVSADGSIGGVYRASIQLAEQSGGGSGDRLKGIRTGWRDLVGGSQPPEAKPSPAPSPSSEVKQEQKSEGGEQPAGGAKR